MSPSRLHPDSHLIRSPALASRPHRFVLHCPISLSCIMYRLYSLALVHAYTSHGSSGSDLPCSHTRSFLFCLTYPLESIHAVEYVQLYFSVSHFATVTLPDLVNTLDRHHSTCSILALSSGYCQAYAPTCQSPFPGACDFSELASTPHM